MSDAATSMIGTATDWPSWITACSTAVLALGTIWDARKSRTGALQTELNNRRNDPLRLYLGASAVATTRTAAGRRSAAPACTSQPQHIGSLHLHHLRQTSGQGCFALRVLVIEDRLVEPGGRLTNQVR